MWFLQPGITFEHLVIRILAVLTIIFLVLPFHEFMHAYIAHKLGDSTAKAMGRLTMNPIAHFDIIGAICMMLFDFGWAKPVFVDKSYFKNPRRDMALVSLAGPLAHVAAALVGGVVMNLIIALGFSSYFVYTFFLNYISINVSLAVINLLPLSSLDGSKILEALIPKRFLDFYYQHQPMISILIFFLILFGFFSIPMFILQKSIYSFIIKVTSLPF